jgi:hypothetical protein
LPWSSLSWPPPLRDFRPADQGAGDPLAEQLAVAGRRAYEAVFTEDVVGRRYLERFEAPSRFERE